MQVATRVAWLAVVLAIPMVSGCGGNGITPMYDVTGEEFALYYGAPRLERIRYEYRGMEGDYHVIDHYGHGAGGTFWPGLLFSMRAHKEDLPAGFPTAPQPPMSDQFHDLSPEDQEYMDRISELRRNGSIPRSSYDLLPLPATPPGGW